MNAAHLVIFTRVPRAGQGKRRLARDIGDIGAFRFQYVMVARLLRTLARDRRWRTWLAVTPERCGPWPASLSVLAQGRGSLGQRMAAVLAQLPPGPAVIVGSDIPGIRAADVRAAFRALGSHDVVVGPARDGGYWLIGLRRPLPRIDPFAHVRWSSEHALEDTLRNFNGRRIARLRTLADVDNGEDWQRFQRGELA
jgi:rSAM/selenodomain-associated transferase 1